MMALAGLGYDQKTIIHMLSLVPDHIETTEERIAIALQSISLPL